MKATSYSIHIRSFENILLLYVVGISCLYVAQGDCQFSPGKLIADDSQTVFSARAIGDMVYDCLENGTVASIPRYETPATVQAFCPLNTTGSIQYIPTNGENVLEFSFTRQDNVNATYITAPGSMDFQGPDGALIYTRRNITTSIVGDMTLEADYLVRTMSTKERIRKNCPKGSSEIKVSYIEFYTFYKCLDN